MLKLEFQNAVAEDHGYGLEVNGKSLEEIISTALGTRAEGKGGYTSGLPSFKSNCCDITVIIDPKPVTVNIEDDSTVWESVKELEEDRIEQYRAETEKTEAEE